MALTDNQKDLIRCIVDNDLRKAKTLAKLILEEDTSKKNEWFCKNMKDRLENQHNFIELPGNLQSILTMEDVSLNFKENRYLLTGSEEEIFNKIKQTNETNNKLTEMGIRYTNTTMLYGESGTGKTTFGRYVAYKLGLPFAYLNFSHCISSFLGETSKNIVKVFEYVSKQKCVFMIDEIDAIGIKRGKEDLGEMSRVVIGLMQAFDLLENGVIVIAATNRIDMIDKALLRRFNTVHEVKPLKPVQIEKLIYNFLKDINIEVNTYDLDVYCRLSNGKQSGIIQDLIYCLIDMINNNSSEYRLVISSFNKKEF